MTRLLAFLFHGQAYVGGGRLTRGHPWGVGRRRRLNETWYALGKWRFVVWSGRLR